MRAARIYIMALAILGVVYVLHTAAVRAQPFNEPGFVFVAGRHLLRDGRPWIPHGFVQIAFVVTPNVPNTKLIYTTASEDYSPDEYRQMHIAGADSVRIQVSQPGLDPQNSLYTAEFRDRVIRAIQAARVAGLTVIVSVQNEPQTGDIKPSDLPDDATQRVWRELAPHFGTDLGVLFEMFNEPRPAPSGADVQPDQKNWVAWAESMNNTIRTIRKSGALNVLVADGLQYGETLDGAPFLTDPLQQVTYASHPYAHRPADQTAAVWDQKFGGFSRTAPVIITEWNTGYYCDANTPGAVLAFLGYLQAHEIGLEVVTWDWSSANFGSAVYDFPNDKFSSFIGSDGRALSCSAAGFGLGKVVKTWYRTGIPPTGIE